MGLLNLVDPDSEASDSLDLSPASDDSSGDASSGLQDFNQADTQAAKSEVTAALTGNTSDIQKMPDTSSSGALADVPIDPIVPTNVSQVNDATSASAAKAQIMNLGPLQLVRGADGNYHANFNSSSDPKDLNKGIPLADLGDLGILGDAMKGMMDLHDSVKGGLSDVKQSLNSVKSSAKSFIGGPLSDVTKGTDLQTPSTAQPAKMSVIAPIKPISVPSPDSSSSLNF